MNPGKSLDLNQLFKRKLIDLYGADTTLLDLENLPEIVVSREKMDTRPRSTGEKQGKLKDVDYKINFGIIRKDDKIWTFDPEYIDLIEPIITREAFLYPFQRRYWQNQAALHLCNWLAFASMKNVSIKRRFWDEWLRNTLAGKEPLNIYFEPPVILREIHRASDMDPKRIHELMLVFMRDNQQYLNLKITPDITWLTAINKVVAFTKQLKPVEMTLIYHATKSFLKDKIIPARNAMLDLSLKNPSPFTNTKISRRKLITSLPKVIGNLSFVYLMDTAHVFMHPVYIFIHPKASLNWRQWDDLFNFPGMSLRMGYARGSLSTLAYGSWTTLIFLLFIPLQFINDLVLYLKHLEQLGLFLHIEAFRLEDVRLVLNLNNYIPDEKDPYFSFNCVHRNEDLVFHSKINYYKDHKKKERFLYSLDVQDFSKFKQFLDYLQSPFTVYGGRFNSWMTILSKMCNARRETVRSWFEKYVLNADIFIPDCLTFYNVQPLVPRFSTLYMFSQVVPDSKMRRIYLPFVNSSISRAQNLLTGKEFLFWQLRTRPKYINDATSLITRLEPDCRMLELMNLEITLKRFRSVSWFNYTKRELKDLGELFGDYVDLTEKLFRKLITWREFKKRAVVKWQREYYQYDVESTSSA
ncbi:MAG: hypothetical protein ACTSRA_14785 [Promethearchaeota archaeon]